MSAYLSHLHSLRHWLTSSLAAVFREALAIEQPAGSSPGWLAACQYHRIAPIDEAERETIRRGQKPLRGAPVMELSQMVTSVVRQARQTLHAVPSYGSPAGESALEQLRILLDRVDREVVEAYKLAVLPKRQGMFGNVLAHHQESSTPSAAPSAHVFTCRTCGAPRLSPRDFNCPFCGNHMATES